MSAVVCALAVVVVVISNVNRAIRAIVKKRVVLLIPNRPMRECCVLVYVGV